MKKLMILVVGSCSLAACATLGQPAFDWTGQNFDSYVMKYGTPTSQYRASNGNMVYSFKKTCEYDPMKEGETLVTVGEGNLIQTISTPTPCPSYYESPAYEIDQRRQEMEREREKRRIERKGNEERIEYLEQALRGLDMDISFQKNLIDYAQFDIEYAKQRKDTAGLAEAEQKLKKAQDELRKDEKYKEEWENEIRQLKSMQYRY